MFVLSELQDSVRIKPSALTGDRARAIEEALVDKFCGKVIPEVGECVSVYDVLSVGPGMIQVGDAQVRHLVRFRLVVFRPFVGEIIVGQVTECDAEGVRVTLPFFGHIQVPTTELPDHIRLVNHQWMWRYDAVNTYEISRGDVCRIRVVSVEFNHPLKVKPDPRQSEESAADRPHVMRVLGSLREDGLGNPAWWW